MRRLHFGIVAVLLAFTYGGLMVWRLERVPALHVTPGKPPAPNPEELAADVKTVKSDLCRVARAELAFFASTGQYALEHELRTGSELNLPPHTRLPYRYRFAAQSPGGFEIIASAPEAYPPAPMFVVDERWQVCTITVAPQSQEPAGARRSYNCEKCE